MRPSSALLRLAICLSSLAPLASAWPGWLPDVDSLIARQDDVGEDTTATAEQTSEPTITESEVRETATESASPTEDEGEDEDEDSSRTIDLNTATPESESGTRTRDRTSEPTRTKFGQNDYPGGVKILTPDTTAAATALYKIGDYVTLGWNYTSLKATPTAIDVLLSCSTASQTWTLTSNMTFETTVSYIWDTDDQANAAESPLLTEMYTLIIKDSEAEVSELPEPGYLGSYQGFTFGLYHGRDYTPLPEWECVGCSAAPGAFDSRALKLSVIMTIVTVLSFTWFVSGLGLQ